MKWLVVKAGKSPRLVSQNVLNGRNCQCLVSRSWSHPCQVKQEQFVSHLFTLLHLEENLTKQSKSHRIALITTQDIFSKLNSYVPDDLPKETEGVRG